MKNKENFNRWHREYRKTEKYKLYMKEYYKSDKFKKYMKSPERKYKTCKERMFLRLKLMIILDNIECSKCKNQDIRVLEIDHIDQTYKKERRMDSTGLRYYITHPEEAKLKLQILCANCHKIKTYENKENRKFNLIDIYNEFINLNTFNNLIL